MLPRRECLESHGQPVTAIYFLENGVASTVVSAHGAKEAEAGMIGREGVTGHAAMLGVDCAPFDVFMQIPGQGWRIPVSDLLRAMDESTRLRQTLLRHVHLFRVQTSYTALANARYTLEERLARWLLMAQDRGDTPEVRLTHEFLSLMLGVQRPSVSVTLKQLEIARLIRVRRGGITILDRAALQGAAHGSYGAPEAEYRRLFGISH